METKCRLTNSYVSPSLNFAGWFLSDSAIFAKSTPSRTIHIVGVLSHDLKGRWSDNKTIRTSAVKEVMYVAEENITVISTRNSVYFVKGNLMLSLGLNGVLLLAGDAIFEMAEADEVSIGEVLW